MTPSLSPDLQQRLDVYREMEAPHPQCVDIVSSVLDSGLVGETLTDETHGSLVSHLIAALKRHFDGEETIENPPSASLEEVNNKFPETREQATKVSDHIQQHFDIDLPESEDEYISIHLAAIALSSKTKESS